MEAHGTRDTNTQRDTYPRSRRTAPQESGDISTEPGGMPKFPKNETGEKNGPPSPLSPSSLPLTKQTTPQRSSTSRVHAQSHQHNVGQGRRRCILKPPCTEEARPIHVRALTTRTSYIKDSFGMATCTYDAKQPPGLI